MLDVTCQVEVFCNVLKSTYQIDFALVCNHDQCVVGVLIWLRVLLACD